MAKKTGEGRPGKVARSRRASASNRPKPRNAPENHRPKSDGRHANEEDETLPKVVGIGASAGGLDAFRELLSHLPPGTGMAFVLIQHLDPKHDSHLAELLSRECKMPVSEVKGETRARANQVYVIPPGCNLTISGGVLQTTPREASGRNMPIDSFLRDLAADRGSQAIGVVLSGTASDGTAGLTAIKAAGGVTFAQEIRTAKSDSMPRSAIAAGVVDYVLPPVGIARQLAALAGAHFPIENWERE